VIKWKCTLCYRNIESEVKPPLLERMCKPCKIKHWKTVVSIYKPGGGIRYEEAKASLLALIAEEEGK